jgi:hypothetical protein
MKAKKVSGFLLFAILLGIRQPLAGLESEPPAKVSDPRTKQDLEEIRQWDEEDERLERRAAWEMPLALGLMLGTLALVEKDASYAYAGGFSGATGLTVRFWPKGTRASKPSTP